MGVGGNRNRARDSLPPAPTHCAVCTITTNENRLPPPAPPIPLSTANRAEEERQLEKLMSLGRVQPSASPTTAAPFFNKACLGCAQLHCTCGQRRYERRWVNDYRPLNVLTRQDAYPFPSTPELMSLIPGHEYDVEFDIDFSFYLVPSLSPTATRPPSFVHEGYTSGP